MTFGSAAVTAILVAGMIAIPAAAEVRFGKNVRIGGHDVSNQTFNKKRRGEFHIHRTAPRHPGCRWRKNGDGSRTKVCHLKRKGS
ncbi:MAG: hypothetical protein Q7T86_12080 [Hyphomicrobiaceae bacterium]|nr:hypothetical protein [Hyphomicrobiaceae bacterium]